MSTCLAGMLHPVLSLSGLTAKDRQLSGDARASMSPARESVFVPGFLPQHWMTLPTLGQHWFLLPRQEEVPLRLHIVNSTVQQKLIATFSRPAMGVLLNACWLTVPRVDLGGRSKASMSCRMSIIALAPSSNI